NQDAVDIDSVLNRPHRAIAKHDVEPGRMGGTPHTVIAAVVIRVGRAPMAVLLRLVAYADVRRNRGIDATHNIGIDAPPVTFLVVAIGTAIQVDAERLFAVQDRIGGAV